jgi:hypothetical protein
MLAVSLLMMLRRLFKLVKMIAFEPTKPKLRTINNYLQIVH